MATLVVIINYKDRILIKTKTTTENNHFGLSNEAVKTNTYVHDRVLSEGEHEIT